MTQRTAVIIVAGGSGRRMGGTLPKQFMVAGGKPLLMHTIQCFADALEVPHLIIVVLPYGRLKFWEGLCLEYDFRVPHVTCEGGETRFDSVRNGLKLTDDAELIAVHDGVRPLASPTLIRRLMADGKLFGAAIPVVTPVDSLREITGEGSRIADRAHFRIVQTPQVFHARVIREAYAHPRQNSYTDDAGIVEGAGYDIHLSEGDYNNFKITTPADIAAAEAMMARK